MGEQKSSGEQTAERQEGTALQQPPAAQSSLARTLTSQVEHLLASHPLHAVDLAEHAYQAAQQAGDPEQMALARVQGGHAQLVLGDTVAAEPLLQEGHALAEGLGERRLLARALAVLGGVYVQTGQYGDALHQQLQSLRLVQELRDKEGEARTLNYIGYLYICLRDYEQALKYHRDACSVAHTIGHLALEISAAVNVAVSHALGGNPALALQINEKTLARIRGQQMATFEVLLRGNLASNLVGLERFSEALEACTPVLESARELGLRESECDVLITRAAARSRLGQLGAAVADLELALRLAEGLPASQQLLTGYHELARILEELGDAPGALGALRRHHQLETELLEAALYGRTRLLAMQLQLDRLEFQAAEQQRRGDQLAAINRTLQATQAELAYRAAHDTLTGLPNRPALDQQLEAICQTSPPQLTAVLFIDLDHFKQINDTLGHPVGDQLLQEVAQRLLRTVQPGDVVARQGGDEFALLLRSVQDIAQAKQTAQRLLEQLSTPVEVGGRPLFISASIGIALFPQHGGDAVTLQKHADLALHEAKQERGRYRIYQPALGAEALEQLTLEQAMHSALQTGGFSLHYQPVVDSCSGCPLMVEALLRWRSPWGEVSPRLFIPIAERSDLILHLGLWVARTALHQLREWRQIWPELKVSVNVSARQLTQPDLPEQFAALLHESGLDPSALVLELTEAAAVDSRRLRAFQELQEAGLSVALDDVGTGYASLAGLAQLPMQMIKIDRSLTAQVASAPQGRSTRPLMNALITFGRESGLHVVAEGVETAEQLEVLRSWGPIQIQGYLESPPLPTADMTEYLQWKAKHCPAQECE